jgi:cellulose biosynthesis protein BcsQ
MDGLRQRFGDTMTNATIRESTRLAEAPSFKLPITAYDPKGGAAEDFRALATELNGRAN